MSEKVFELYEKDALKDNVNVLFANPFCLWHIEPKKLVPVVLQESYNILLKDARYWRVKCLQLMREKSVSLEWLEKEIKDYIEDESIEEAWILAADLLSAAKKQAREVKKENELQ